MSALSRQLATALAGSAISIGANNLETTAEQNELNISTTSALRERLLTPREQSFAALDSTRFNFAEEELNARDIKQVLEMSSGLKVELLSDSSPRREGFSARESVELFSGPVTGSQLLQRFSRELSAQTGQDINWQVLRDGRIQLGTEDDLSAQRERQIYSVADLLHVATQFKNAPDFDLDAALQAGQGGNTGRLFGDPQRAADREARAESLERLRELIVETIEPEQWEEGGGKAQLRVFRENFIVVAPEFVHRQLAGRQK